MLVAALTVAPAAVAKPSTSCPDEEARSGVPPTTIAEPPAASVLASYAVLRRPATAADLPPPINSLAKQVDFSIGRYNPAYVRQLTQRPGGRRFFVVPGMPVHVEIAPARCLPRAVRRQRPALVEAQRRRELQPIACVVTSAPPGSRRSPSYGENCLRFRDVTTYRYLSDGLIDGVEDAGILPDGIATVRVHFSRAPVVQVPVVENFYLYQVDPVRRKRLLRRFNRAATRLERSPTPRTRAQQRRYARRYVALNERAVKALTPTHIELLGADGQVVKDLRRPKRSGGLVFIPPAQPAQDSQFEDFCLQNPGTC